MTGDHTRKAMNILLLNPNTSKVMTEHIMSQASRDMTPGVRLKVATAAFGGSVIASRVSYAIAAHAVLDMYAGQEENFDAIIIACFGDPGLEALRELSGLPVTGLLEAAIKDAARAGSPYAIVTAGTAWVPMLEERIQISPHAAMSRGVIAFGTNGLDVVNKPDHFVKELQAAVQTATDAGAQSVILGGSALAGFGPRLETAARLIDPLQSALRYVQALVHTGAPAKAADENSTGKPARISYTNLSPDFQRLLAG